jgi:hypothetical protein
MKRIACAAAILSMLAAPAWARSILFVGNSFTFGEFSAAKHYRTDTVTDLNGPDAGGRTLGGMPAIFKAMAQEAGLDYQVSLETAPGMGLDYHYANKLKLLDRSWDDVVLQSFSTLDAAHPGDPALLTRYTKLFGDVLSAKNPQVNIYLSATWSRADLTYPAGKPWSGKPIQQMGVDIAAAYAAAAKNAKVTGVVPMGLAWNRAIDTGVAGGDPYAGIPAGKINLWSWDSYHASAYGYYLEALLVFAKITGKDPQSLGDTETVADDMGFSKPQTHALQQLAHDQLAASNQLGQ